MVCDRDWCGTDPLTHESKSSRARRHAATAAIVVSIITAIAAITGIVISVWTQIVAENIAAQAAHSQSLQLALSMATDGTNGPDRRISGVYQLEQFWRRTSTDDISQITSDQNIVGSTLNALLLSEDRAGANDVRCAAAEAIGSAYQRIVGKFEKPDDPRYIKVREFLFGTNDAEVGGLVSRSNVLHRLRDSKLSDRNIPAATDLRSPTETAEVGFQKTITCSTEIDATKEAIRKSWNDLRSTNLQSTDLSYSYLYEADLHRSNLVQADLRGADLHCANLSDVIVSQTDLTDADLYFTNLHGVNSADLMGVSEPVLQTAIDISDEQWIEWKRDGFRLSKLKELMGDSYPKWAQAFRDGYCTP